MPTSRRRMPSDVWLMLAVFVAAMAWSLIRPADYATWFFEIVPGSVGVIVLAAVAPWFRFSRLLYVVVAIHFVVLAAGAKYTYAEMPLFDWLRDAWGLSRNHFDRVGHFFQGLTAAVLTRELLIRRATIGRGWMTGFLSVCVGLAFSAFYELLEWWWVVLFYPDSGPQWLGMQGDPWDAQGDMFMALCGALFVVTVMARLHNHSIDRLDA